MRINCTNEIWRPVTTFICLCVSKITIYSISCHCIFEPKTCVPFSLYEPTKKKRALRSSNSGAHAPFTHTLFFLTSSYLENFSHSHVSNNNNNNLHFWAHSRNCALLILIANISYSSTYIFDRKLFFSSGMMRARNIYPTHIPHIPFDFRAILSSPMTTLVVIIIIIISDRWRYCCCSAGVSSPYLHSQ